MRTAFAKPMRVLLAVLLATGLWLAPAALAQNDAAHQQFLFAYKLLQRGEDPLAVQAFDEYLGRFPDDAKRADALYYRALLARRQGDNAAAAKLLASATEPTLVPRHALSLLRGQVLTDLKQFDAALAALEQMDPSGLDTATAASAWYLRGMAYRGSENLPAAAKALAEAAAVDSPLRGRAAIDLARVQALLGQPDRAVKTLDAALAFSGGDAVAQASRLMGDLLYRQGQHDAAISAYARVATQHQSSPQFGPSVTGILWSQLAAGRHADLLQTYLRYRDLLPPEEKPTADYLAGSSLAATGRHADAVQALQRVETAGQTGDLLEKTLYKLAASQFELKQHGEMQQTIGRLQRMFPQSPLLMDAAFLLAAARAEEGSLSDAVKGLGELIDQGSQSPYYGQALLRRGMLYEGHNKPAEAARDYVRYLEHQVSTPRAASAQESQVFLRLVDLYQRLGHHAYAAGLAGEWLAHMTLQPDTRQEALYRLAVSQAAQQQPDAALATLDRLRSEFPDGPFSGQAAYYRGLVLSSMGRSDEALQALTQAMQAKDLAQPVKVAALRLTAMLQRELDVARAEQALTQLEQLAGRSAMEPRELLWLATRRLSQQKPVEALGYAEALTQRGDRLEPRDLGGALLLAGRALRQQGDLDAATQRFEHALAVSPQLALEARLELARTQRAAGQHQQALDELEGLISAEQASVAAWAAYEAAMIHRDLAQQRRRQDDQPGARQHELEARPLLKRLVLLYPLEDLLPLPQMAYIELAEISQTLGESDAAQAELRELLTKFGKGPWATLGRAREAVGRQRYGEAAALLEQIGAAQDVRLVQKVAETKQELPRR